VVPLEEEQLTALLKLLIPTPTKCVFCSSLPSLLIRSSLQLLTQDFSRRADDEGAPQLFLFRTFADEVEISQALADVRSRPTPTTVFPIPTAAGTAPTRTTTKILLPLIRRAAFPTTKRRRRSSNERRIRIPTPTTVLSTTVQSPRTTSTAGKTRTTTTMARREPLVQSTLRKLRAIPTTRWTPTRYMIRRNAKTTRISRMTVIKLHRRRTPAVFRTMSSTRRSRAETTVATLLTIHHRPRKSTSPGVSRTMRPPIPLRRGTTPTMLPRVRKILLHTTVRLLLFFPSSLLLFR
jgi:hypothetical protein